MMNVMNVACILTIQTKKYILEKDRRRNTTRYSANVLQHGVDNTGDEWCCMLSTSLGKISIFSYLRWKNFFTGDGKSSSLGIKNPFSLRIEELLHWGWKSF